MKGVIFISGPRGCGKTSNGKRFAKHYGAAAVWEEAEFFDDRTKSFNDAIVLLDGDRVDLTPELLKIFNGRVVNFYTAMLESEPRGMKVEEKKS